MNASTDAPARAYSTRELRAAAAALAAGTFTSAPAHHASLAAELTHHGDAEGLSTTVPSDYLERSGDLLPAIANLVRVRAAHAGAGASTTALAIADAADATGLKTRVLDAATPRWSGLVGATVTELGASHGWRRGRRGEEVLIERVEEPVALVSQVPTPTGDERFDLTVLDAGWSSRELAAAPTWIAAAAAAIDVLVTRPVELALSQTEASLHDLEEHHPASQVLVVVVGPTKWGRELSMAGPRLRRAHENAAVSFLPLLPPKSLSGLGPTPLPRQLTKPAQRLLEQITNITGPLTASRATRGEHA